MDSHLYLLQDMTLILKVFFYLCFNRYLLQSLSDSVPKIYYAWITTFFKVCSICFNWFKVSQHIADFLNVTLLYLKNIFYNTANTRSKLHKVTLIIRDKCIGLGALYIP